MAVILKNLHPRSMKFRVYPGKPHILFGPVRNSKADTQDEREIEISDSNVDIITGLIKDGHAIIVGTLPKPPVNYIRDPAFISDPEIIVDPVAPISDTEASLENKTNSVP